MTYDSIGNLTLVGKIEINAEEFKSNFVEAFPESVTRYSIYEGSAHLRSSVLCPLRSDSRSRTTSASGWWKRDAERLL